MTKMTGLVFLFFFLPEIFGAFTCKPEVDCENSNPGGTVPDPYNCEKYFVCIQISNGLYPSDVSIFCPSGQYYDGRAGLCSLETVPGTCDIDYCGPINPPQCQSTCVKLSDLIANIYDCQSYYECFPNGLIFHQCESPTLYFNGSTCVSDPWECCNFCNPYCIQVTTHLIDPLDCTKYYICTTVGPVDENLHVSCPTDTYFSAPLGDCVAGTSCTPVCPEDIKTRRRGG